MTRLRTLFSSVRKRASERNPKKYYSGATQDLGDTAESTDSVVSKALELVKYRYFAFADFTGEGDTLHTRISLEDLNEEILNKNEKIHELLKSISIYLFQIIPILGYKAAKKMIEDFVNKYQISQQVGFQDLYDSEKLKSIFDEVKKSKMKDTQNLSAEEHLEILRDVDSIKDFMNYYVQRDLYASYRRLLYNIIYRNAFAYTNNLEKSKNRIGGLLESLDDYRFYPLGRGGLGYTINISSFKGIQQSYSEEEKNIDLETFNSLSRSEQRFIVMILTEIIRLFSEILVTDGIKPNPNANMQYYEKGLEILRYLSDNLIKIQESSQSKQDQQDAIWVYNVISTKISTLISGSPTQAFLKLYPVVCWLVRTELQIYMDELGQEVVKNQTEKVIHDPDKRDQNLAKLRNASHFLSTKDVLQRSIEEKTKTLINIHISELENQLKSDLSSMIANLSNAIYELYSEYNIVLTSPFLYELLPNSDFIKEITDIGPKNRLQIAVNGIIRNLLIPVLFYPIELTGNEGNVGEVTGSVRVYRTNILLDTKPEDLYAELSNKLSGYLLTEIEQLIQSSNKQNDDSAVLRHKLLKGFVASTLASMNNSSYILLVPTFIIPSYSHTEQRSIKDNETHLKYEKKYVKGVDINKIIQLYKNLEVEFTNYNKFDNVRDSDFIELRSMYQGSDIFIYDTSKSSNKIKVENIRSDLFVTR